MQDFKMGVDRHLLVNVREAVQDFPEESPKPVLVLVQAVVDGVPQSAFFTVFHLSRHREHDRPLAVRKRYCTTACFQSETKRVFQELSSEVTLVKYRMCLLVCTGNVQ